MRIRGCRLDDGLVFRCQAVVGLLVDEDVELRAAFPPSGVVVVRRDLVEAELQVVVGADPLGRIDRSLLERLVDLAAGDVLRHAAHALDDLAGEAADAELQALEVGGGLDLLAIPAAHLGAGVSAREIDDVVGLVEIAHQRQAVAVVHPRRHLPRVEAERNRAAEGEALVLAEEVVRCRVRDLDRGRLHAVDHAERRHQLAGRVRGDRELAAGHVADLLGEHFGRTEDRVERPRKTRGEAPADVGLGVDDGRRRTGGNDARQTGLADE